MEGYEDLATAMASDGDGPDALPALIASYLEFAREQPSTYEAMASARSSIVFASDETPEVLRRGFEMLARAVGVLA